MNFKQNIYDEMLDKTRYYQKIYGFKHNEKSKTHSSWNNEADAFKHAFSQAVLSLRYGNIAAYIGAMQHEIEGNLKRGQSKDEENMDTWNNRVGRDVADDVRKIKSNFGNEITNEQIEDIVAAKVIERMRKGDLITHPSDKRNYKNYDKYFKNNKNTDFATNIANDMGKIYYALEDVGKMTTEEFLNIESTVNRQMAEGTMQNKEYFENQVKNGSLIWIDEYIRKDGTKVKGHYRAKAL